MKKQDNNNDEHFQDEPDSPLLDKLKNSGALQVPDGYFETLPQNIMKRIEELPAGSVKARQRYLYPVLAIAAMVGLMAFLFWLLKPVKVETERESVAQVLNDKEAILEYLIDNESIDEESLIGALSPENCDNLRLMPQDSILPAAGNTNNDKAPEASIVIDSTITSDDILQYLIEEGIDVSPE
jgi:hypothetical protein